MSIDMDDSSGDIEKALQAALDALQPVTTDDGLQQPQDVIEAVMQLARVVVALEELHYQQLVAGHQAAKFGSLH